MAVRNGASLNYLLNDHLGSTSVILKTNGTLWGELRYSAWGETRYSNGTIVTDRQFTGQINDGATGLYYYNARYYDPALHRFIQADTIVPDPNDPQTLNRFSYTNNNPVRYTDPTGHYVDDGGGGSCGSSGVCVDAPSDLTPASFENNPRCQKIGMSACMAELGLTTVGTFSLVTVAEAWVLGGAAANSIWAAEVAISEGIRQGAQALGQAFGNAAIQVGQVLFSGSAAASSDGDPNNEVIAANRALHELQKVDYRSVMRRPPTIDPTLTRLMDNMYRENATVGSGSTADAMRYELTTGLQVGGRSHLQKGWESVTAFNRWLQNNPTARPGDRAAAENVLLDLLNALGTYPK